LSGPGGIDSLSAFHIDGGGSGCENARSMDQECDPPVRMLTKRREQAKRDDKGLGFTNALQEYLTPAVVVVDNRGRIVGLSGRAEQIPGLSRSKAFPQSMDTLPAPMRKIVLESLASGKPLVWHDVDLQVEGRGTVPFWVTAEFAQTAKKDCGAIWAMSGVSFIL